MKRVSATALVLALAVSALTGCSAPAAHVAGAAPQGVPVAEVSQVRDYADVDELLAQSTLVVVGHPTSRREEVIADLPFTVVTFDVEKASGKDADDANTIDVRYSGGAKLSFSGLPALPYEGQSYVLVLQPFTFDGTTATGQYIVVGPGQWVNDGKSASYTLDVIAYEPAAGSAIPGVLDGEAVEELSAAAAAG